MVSCISEATANINEYKKFHYAFNVRCLKIHFKLHTEQSEMSGLEVLLAFYKKILVLYSPNVTHCNAKMTNFLIRTVRLMSI